jgi:NADPH-dependent curcumin reductase CurA
VFYDNVGGETADVALANANENGRVIFCGSIAGYNGDHVPIKVSALQNTPAGAMSRTHTQHPHRIIIKYSSST